MNGMGAFSNFKNFNAQQQQRNNYNFAGWEYDNEFLLLLLNIFDRYSIN